MQTESMLYTPASKGTSPSKVGFHCQDRGCPRILVHVQRILHVACQRRSQSQERAKKASKMPSSYFAVVAKTSHVGKVSEGIANPPTSSNSRSGAGIIVHGNSASSHAAGAWSFSQQLFCCCDGKRNIIAVPRAYELG